MTANLTGLAVLGVATLIGTQVFSAPPQTFKVEHYANQVTTSAPAPSTPEAKAKAQQKSEEKSHASVFEPPSGVPDDDK
jgi:hypothetical protein